MGHAAGACWERLSVDETYKKVLCYVLHIALILNSRTHHKDGSAGIKRAGACSCLWSRCALNRRLIQRALVAPITMADHATTGSEGQAPADAHAEPIADVAPAPSSPDATAVTAEEAAGDAPSTPSTALADAATSPAAPASPAADASPAAAGAENGACGVWWKCARACTGSTQHSRWLLPAPLPALVL